MSENANLAAVLSRLDALTDWERRPRNRMRVGLEPARDLASRLCNPQLAFRAVHVGGTKGKGSVSALIEAGLARAGVAVGRYGSPHVEHVTERVSLQGRDVAPDVLARALDRALDAYEAARREGTAAADATWFDCLTMAAFLIFRDAAVGWAVIEVGLGGRLDSTNIIESEVAVITNIGLEHTEILGDTRAAIAGEKAGIIKPGETVVTTLAAGDEAGRVIAERARALGCTLLQRPGDAGATIEETNVALAGAVLDVLGAKGVNGRSSGPVAATLLDANTRARARLVGRMERITLQSGSRSVPVVLDGAHVPFNVAAVLSDLARSAELTGPCVAVVALAKDKDAEGFLAEIGKRADTVVCTSVPSTTRGRLAEDVRAIAESLGVSAEAEPDPHRAFRRGLMLASRAGGWLLVTGSLYLVGELRSEALKG
jgi:dihydrofolate synthase/folylpolyglutamate synthase